MDTHKPIDGLSRKMGCGKHQILVLLGKCKGIGHRYRIDMRSRHFIVHDIGNFSSVADNQRFEFF
ncbi:hypothetical protein SDC9_121545 [bioreactor metagenome]|uniref:Uncharacterized protein n=1 Tax=bioreactor metagenome TaxID=1076179 RepID=A0A645CC90_9ZZZZ